MEYCLNNNFLVVLFLFMRYYVIVMFIVLCIIWSTLSLGSIICIFPAVFDCRVLDFIVGVEL